MALLDAMAPDLVLVEMFPFGRPWFRFEIVPLLEALRGDGVPAVCSVRDVLVRKQDPAAYARQVLEDLDRYFSAVLVHSDPALIRLEETFPAADGIRVPVYYTGYVAGAGHDRHGGFGLDEKTEGNSRSTEQKRPVFRRVARQGLLAWTGSGALGGAVVEAILEAAGQGLLPDKGKARVYAGPALDQAQRSRLNQLARGAAGVVLRTFTNRLRRHLNSARVAVCMAGYMSAVDIMASRTPAVMIPGRQGGEQPFRARKLEEAGYVRVLPLDDLSAHSLARKVEDALGPREEPVRVDLNGARRSAEIVEAIMDGKPLAPSN